MNRAAIFVSVRSRLGTSEEPLPTIPCAATRVNLQTALVFPNERQFLQFIIIPLILEFSQVLGQKEAEQSGSQSRKCRGHVCT